MDNECVCKRERECVRLAVLGGQTTDSRMALGKQSAVSTISKCYHPYLTGVRTDSKKLKLTHRYFIGKGQCRA